jgi:hypothetical protein
VLDPITAQISERPAPEQPLRNAKKGAAR